MKLLIDNALSHHLAGMLRSEGIDSVHLREKMAVDSPDEAVFEFARNENRIIVSSDTDFGAIFGISRPLRHFSSLPFALNSGKNTPNL